MHHNAEAIEKRRCELQVKLDGHKSQTQLARGVVAYGLGLLEARVPVRFLDPAIGTGSFYSALVATAQGQPVESAVGFEIDPHYGEPSQELWKGTELKISLTDFTKQKPFSDERKRATLLICNPPYVRHHHLSTSEKTRLKIAALDVAGVKLSGLAGLYCYFMALAHDWMADGGVAGWLIPSEFMDVNYGRALKAYLLSEVTLLHIHRFDPNDVQFDDALVSSAVVWFKKEKSPPNHHVKFSYGGTMQQPASCKSVSVVDLEGTEKWTRYPRQEVEVRHDGYRLGDLFKIKRGLATGDNNFFILSEEAVHDLNLPHRFLRPILPSTRYIKSNEIKGDENGLPLLEKRLFLLDCDRPAEEIARDEPALWSYLQTGIEQVAPGYLCRTRRLWYMQERRPASPIVCTYIGRSDHDGRPFRFLLNNSLATATNVYLMLYPQPVLADALARDPGVLRRLWLALNSIAPEVLLGNGRVYGGGMHKLEPKELANVPADDLAAIAGLGRKRTSTQMDLVEALAA